MNFKNLFGTQTDASQTAALKAMAARVATLAGCQALELELAEQRLALPASSQAARQLSRKIDELKRLQTALAMEEDRPRMAAAVKADQEEGSKALKAAEARLKAAIDTATESEARRVQRAALVDQLALELQALHGQADQAVGTAEVAMSEVFASSQGDAATEREAFERVKQAKLHRATCGESLASRLRGHETELQRLEGAASAAAAQLDAERNAVHLCRLALAWVAYDVAAQSMVDAYLKLRALPAIDGAGNGLRLSTIGHPDVTFASKDRALLPHHLLGESLRLREWALADAAKSLAPANLALLTEPLVVVEERATADRPAIEQI